MFIKGISFLFILVFFISTDSAFAQCCSTGSPVGASVYVGVLNKNSLRLISYYRHNFSDTYYEGTSTTTENLALKSSNYNFTGLAIGYGISQRLTIETDLGYFLNKTQKFKNIEYAEKGFGLSTGGLTLKYGALVKPSKQFELTAGAGFRFPMTADPQVVDGVQLSRDVQPSTNAMALTGMIFINKGFPDLKMHFFSINRFDHNFQDKLQYKYGDMLVNAVLVSKMIVKNFMGILQLRSEYRLEDTDGGTIRPNTGNLLLILSPQVSYAVAGKWNLSLLGDIPVFKNYNGKQLTPSYSFAIGLTRDFNLIKKQTAKSIQ